MATLHLIVGLPCAGKTTYARRLERDRPALRLTPDEWHLRLFGHDFPGPDHDERHNAIEALLWGIAERALTLGTDVILDFGFWAREEREAFRAKAAGLGAASEVHFLDVPAEELLRRLRERNGQSDAFHIPEEFLLTWMERFEPPDVDELVPRISRHRP